MRDSKFVKHRTKIVVDTATGEVKRYVIALTMHREDFFCAYLRHWGDFGDREGVKMRVFVSCIMVSRLSVFGEREGNFFSVQDAVDDAVANIGGMNAQCARQHIKNLAKSNFIIKTTKRGRYCVNPKYGIKGTISDQTCFEMHEYADGKKAIPVGHGEFVYVDTQEKPENGGIGPNAAFGEGGGDE